MITRPVGVEVSYCIVNTDQRELLLRCLDAVAAEQASIDLETEVLVLDNASTDGSAGAARNHPATTELIRLQHRRGKAENDTALLQRARGRFCILLNEDSEMRPGATRVLYDAMTAAPRAGAGGAKLAAPRRHPAGLGVALPGPRDRADRRAVPAQAGSPCRAAAGACTRSTGRSRPR